MTRKIWVVESVMNTERGEVTHTEGYFWDPDAANEYAEKLKYMEWKYPVSISVHYNFVR